jgi:hypothetical protein
MLVSNSKTHTRKLNEVKFALEQAMKALDGNTGIPLLFL